MLLRLLILGLFAVVGSTAARAQTYTLANHSNLIFGGFTVSITGCTYQLNNSTQSSCSSDNVDFTASMNRGTLSINFENASNPGSAILSQASGSGCTCVSYTLTNRVHSCREFSVGCRYRREYRRRRPRHVDAVHQP